MKRLELASYPIKDIRIGRQLRYDAGVLEIDEQELLALVRTDPRVESATLSVVRPGEKTRVTGVRDLVEPRIKAPGDTQVFPGIIGPVRPVGQGRTHRLSGMTVVAASGYEGIIRTGTTAQRSAILDMWGPGAEITHFSSLLHLVLSLELRPGLPENEAHSAVQQVEYHLACRLAETTLEIEPERVEIFDTAVTHPSLPRAVLILGCITENEHLPSGVSYYGLPVRESLATVIHPNELLDGAVTGNTMKTIAYYPVTWDWQNQALALRLHQDHGKRVNFAGVILQRIRFESFQEKEVAAHSAAQVASALGAQAALITWLGSGNAFLEVMLTIRACERAGIKTVLVTYEYGGKEGTDSPLLFYDETANAVVSTGSRDRGLELPAAERVVGGYRQMQLLNYPGAPLVPAQGPLQLDARDAVVGGIDLWGRSNWTCRPE